MAHKGRLSSGHEWSAALAMALEPDEVDDFLKRATQEAGTRRARYKPTGRRVEVLDVYCHKCGLRPGGEDPGCHELRQQSFPS